MIRRREIITLLGGAAASWPLAARAQQGDRVRRIGVLMAGEETDPTAKARVSAFTQALADLGRTVGRNVRMDRRWGGGDTDGIRALAQELVGLQPDISQQDLRGLRAAATPQDLRQARGRQVIALLREPEGGEHGLMDLLSRPAAAGCQQRSDFAVKLSV